MLEKNTSLRSLNISSNFLCHRWFSVPEEEKVCHIAEGLRKNQVLEKLELCGTRPGASGLRLITEALDPDKRAPGVRTNLKTLDLSGNEILDLSIISKLVSKKTALEKLVFIDHCVEIVSVSESGSDSGEPGSDSNINFYSESVPETESRW